MCKSNNKFNERNRYGANRTLKMQYNSELLYKSNTIYWSLRKTEFLLQSFFYLEDSNFSWKINEHHFLLKLQKHVVNVNAISCSPYLKIIREYIRFRVATGNPVVFTLSPPECYMEIRYGYGTTGNRVGGPVRVGDPLTLIIYMRSKYGK